MTVHPPSLLGRGDRGSAVRRGGPPSRRKLWRIFFTGIIASVILAAVVGSHISCKPAKDEENAMPKRDINAVMESHVNELMAIPGVTGVAIGALDNGTPCILVLVLKESDELKRKIPKSLEGHPVQIFESGEIKPMDGK